MSSSDPHPALSVRPLLAEFDNFITDTQLEALYDGMYLRASPSHYLNRNINQTPVRRCSV